MADGKKDSNGPTCGPCGGTGYIEEEDESSGDIRSHACASCHATGKQPTAGETMTLRARATRLMERYAPKMAPRPYDELLEDVIDELRLVVAETSISVAADTRQKVLARAETTSAMLDEEIEHLAQKASDTREASALVARRHDAQVKSLRARVYQLEMALAEIADEGCDTRPYATNCDSRCKDIARTAILTAPVVEPTS